MTTRTEAAARPRGPLSRDRVLRAAVALADAAGIDALTMRRLGQELGVEAMSLYNHVANKDDLLDAIVDLVLAEIDLPAGDADWKAAIRTCAVSAHDALIRHPWACPLIMSPGSTRTMHPSRMRYMEWLLGRLRRAGFSPDLTYHAYHTLDSHILGFTLWELGHTPAAQDFAGGKSLADLATGFLQELPAGDYPYLAEHVEQHLAAHGDDGTSEFSFGLDLLLDGLERLRDR
jgi:AcrR family transcriptional regulator